MKTAHLRGEPRHDLGLTPRQTQILRFLALGLSRKEISMELKPLRVKTVEYHVTKIREKLKLHSDTQIVRYAIEHGLVKPGDVMQKSNAVESPRFVNPNPSEVPEFKTTGDLAQALLRAAAAASIGKADVLQVTALCQCTNSIIDLARLQIEVSGAHTRVPWLEDKVPKQVNGNGKNNS